MAGLLIQATEERDPFSVQLILNVQRALNIAYVHAFSDGAEDIVLILLKYVDFIFHLLL